MQIVFYTRTGCSLCEQGEKVLARVCADRPYRVIDVDDDPELRAEYGEFVPVVEVDGVKVSQWQVEEARLREAIEGTKKRAPRRLFGRRRAR